MPGKTSIRSACRSQFDRVEELDGGANRNRGKDGGSSPAKLADEFRCRDAGTQPLRLGQRAAISRAPPGSSNLQRTTRGGNSEPIINSNPDSERHHDDSLIRSGDVLRSYSSAEFWICFSAELCLTSIAATQLSTNSDRNDFVACRVRPRVVGRDCKE